MMQALGKSLPPCFAAESAV